MKGNWMFGLFALWFAASHTPPGNPCLENGIQAFKLMYPALHRTPQCTMRCEKKRLTTPETATGVVVNYGRRKSVEKIAMSSSGHRSLSHSWTAEKPHAQRRRTIRSASAGILIPDGGLWLHLAAVGSSAILYLAVLLTTFFALQTAVRKRHHLPLSPKTSTLHFALFACCAPYASSHPLYLSSVN